MKKKLCLTLILIGCMMLLTMGCSLTYHNVYETDDTRFVQCGLLNGLIPLYTSSETYKGEREQSHHKMKMKECPHQMNHENFYEDREECFEESEACIEKHDKD